MCAHKCAYVKCRCVDHNKDVEVSVDDTRSMFANLICDCAKHNVSVYVRYCTSVSLCKVKYASLFANLIACLLCQVKGECVISFTNVQCIV